mgnify:CR=1 FL=1
MTDGQKQSIMKVLNVTNLLATAVVGVVIWLTTSAITRGDRAIERSNEIEKVQIRQQECINNLVESLKIMKEDHSNTMKEIKLDIKEIRKEIGRK